MSKPWARREEVGSRRALRFAAWYHRHMPRRLGMAILRGVAVYFWARGPEMRGALSEYLEQLWRAPGGPGALKYRPGRRDVIRVIHEFAISVYDRMTIWIGELDQIELEHDGSEGLFELAREGRGVLLLSTHVGSLDLMAFVARRHALVVNVVVFQENAARVRGFFESLGGAEQLRVIELDADSVRAAFEIRAALARGEAVAIMADRVAPGRSRVLETEFLGRRTAFPEAPFRLAGLFECPVVFSVCPRIGDRRYRTVMRPLAAGVRVPRAEREKWARELLERYVARVEASCREFPHQWFNFHPFWTESGQTESGQTEPGRSAEP